MYIFKDEPFTSLCGWPPWFTGGGTLLKASGWTNGRGEAVGKAGLGLSLLAL